MWIFKTPSPYRNLYFKVQVISLWLEPFMQCIHPSAALARGPGGNQAFRWECLPGQPGTAQGLGISCLGDSWDNCR